MHQRSWTPRYPVPDYDDDKVREVLVNPYRIIYFVKANDVSILSVMHQRQLLPSREQMLSALDDD